MQQLLDEEIKALTWALGMLEVFKGDFKPEEYKYARTLVDNSPYPAGTVGSVCDVSSGGAFTLQLDGLPTYSQHQLERVYVREDFESRGLGSEGGGSDGG